MQISPFQIEIPAFQLEISIFLIEVYIYTTYGKLMPPLPIFTCTAPAITHILRILLPKNENFQMKNSGSFHISAQNIDCGYLLEPPRRVGSNEYPKSMFSSRNKKNNVYPCNPQFHYIRVGFKGVKTICVFS